MRTPRQGVVIINPLSGAGRHESQIAAHVSLATSVLGAHHIDTVVRTTTRAGDAHAFAREAVERRSDLVVAWGGDGTINETASALVHTEIPLGIVPAGSGNGLASDLKLPFDPAAALGVAATGRTTTIDAGLVDDGGFFFNIAGVGIDAVIAARFNQRGMRRRGLLAYLQLTSAELLRYRCQQYDIRFDDQQILQEAMLIAFANGRQYGNRLLIAPGARLDDGRLEVVIVDPLPLMTIAARLPSLIRGTLRAGRGVRMSTAVHVQIRANLAIPYHVDGEPRLGGTVLTVSCVPAALKVRVPAV
jgi:YegS/Rv2252/BmrU family lipid kinase